MREIKRHGIIREDERYLTSKEMDVARLIYRGLTSKEIASKMGVSQKTTETHRANLMRRMNFHNIADVARYVESTLKVSQPKRKLTLVQVSDAWCVELDNHGKPIRRVELKTIQEQI